MSHHHEHHDHQHGHDHDHHHEHHQPGMGGRLPIHPAWFYGLGFVLVLLVVLVWTLI